MKAQWFGAAFIFVLLVIGYSAWPDIKSYLHQQQLGQNSQQSGYGRANVNFSEITVEALVPLSVDLEHKGLGGRTGLGAREGMLWEYDQPGRPTFWMKDMLIPLDFIWINGKQVIDITPNVPPPAPGQIELPIYQPATPATDVLEVAGGFAAAHNISVGSAVTIDRL